nr:hypothetical protein Iba_chr06cCG6590 [Ipomoea batatas]
MRSVWTLHHSYLQPQKVVLHQRKSKMLLLLVLRLLMLRILRRGWLLFGEVDHQKCSYYMGMGNAIAGQLSFIV